jgi:hypothetical protein
MSNEAVAVLSPGSAYCSFMKTVMTNKVRKILGRLKPGLRLSAKSAELFRKDGVQL